MNWPAIIVIGIFVVAAIAAGIYEAYVAGWNASARYHRNRPKINGAPNPFWREYR